MAVSPFFRSQKDRAPAGAAMSGPEAEHRVVQVIVEAIMDHRVAPGARLIERELAIASGASRSAIRNGLMRLAHAGLVELSPNKGASIAMCSPDEARQIFDARIVIETAAVKKLAGTIGEGELERLRAFVEDEREAYERGRMEDARHLSRRFHVLLAEMAGNDVLTGVIRDLINRQPLLSWSRPETEPRFCGNHAHSEIVEAIASRDGERAAHLNMEHLRALERELGADRAAAMQELRSAQAADGPDGNARQADESPVVD
ncbi:FCD domain-containing protein [Sinorhizobium medicae]|uniref:GntR family transcriptional regulator n=1 Tax=Sinorhizobium medicae TaxID=110321 RepID=UPI000FD4C824|nr:GntR family transcriptional regulator [Sinorhizobium medicae]MDX0440322.1 FCD domain-containing protein [Sinorhizobium medicae]MDX0489962.1 FCD domain-containing protein [Sinorhizobium medicae]MDX0538897.1 FCD domain-containing protein [Sinorhizobium medicae]MDX0717786.1 FCD domain-containing protein [Sinorhizobium medicae]MDX0871343.1 FCD domain-containing protein [Sinorhizobium medicae]